MYKVYVQGHMFIEVPINMQLFEPLEFHISQKQDYHEVCKRSMQSAIIPG